MENKSDIYARLQSLGLSNDEAKIFMDLLAAPKTQLELSRTTGISRSNVYRIVDGMAEKGLICHQATESEKSLVCAGVSGLELLVADKENAARTQRDSLNQMLPLLANPDHRGKDFSIKTYVGITGLKQMLWNELGATSEVLLFSGAPIDIPLGRRWAEKYRKEVVDRGIHIRSIEIDRLKKDPVSEHAAYTKHYNEKYISDKVLDIQFEMSIYGNTISMYNSLGHDIKLGTEITNPSMVIFMRQIFEHYWALAAK